MKLHSPGFEKALRRGVRQRVRNSPELKREFRLANRYRRQYGSKWLIRPATSFGLALLVWHLAAATHHTNLSLAVISAWTFGFVFIHAQGLLSCLFRSTDVSALYLLPVTEKMVFRWELQKFFLRSIMSLIDLIAGFAALALFLNLSVAKWFGLFLIVALTGSMLLAMTALCAARLPGLPYPKICAAMVLILAVIVATGKIFGWSPVIAAFDQWAPALNLLLPTGWPVSLFPLLLADRPWLNLGLLLPIGGLIATLPGSFARLQSYYVFEEIARPEPQDRIPEDTTEARSAMNTSGPMPRRLGLTAIEEILQSRLFLAPPRWPQQGWLESILWRWFSDRERALAEMVFPNGLSITVPWKKIFRNLGVAVLLGFLAGGISATLKIWILGIGIFITLCMVLSKFLETGRAFQLIFCDGVGIPLYAGLAAGLRELSRLLIKFSAVQVPALQVWCVTCGALISILLDMPTSDGIGYGIKAGFLMFASRFILLVFAFSSGTNDSAKLRFSTLALFAALLAFGGLFLVLGGVGLLAPHKGIAWIVTAFAVLDAYAYLRIYSWFYHRNYFDLISIPRK